MSEWQTRITNHPARNTLAALEVVLEGVEVAPDGPAEVVGDIERLRQVRSYVAAVLYGLGPVLIPIAALQALDKPLQNVTNELNQFVANGNCVHLVNANNHVDTVLTHVF